MMKNLRWQFVIIFLTGLVIGILLLGEQKDLASVEATPRPAQGGIYTEAVVGNLQRLNPLLDSKNQPDRDIDRLIFNGLVRFDSRGLPLPDLAESWGISQDGKNYNFTLRPNLKWHDGQPVTADDVIFTIEMMRQGNPSLSQDYQDFWKSVVVKGSGNNLQFQLKESFSPFLDFLTFGILPRHLLGGLSGDAFINAAFNLQPVGTGPFQFERLIVDSGRISGLVLRANKDFYGQKPNLSQIVFLFYPDSIGAVTAYKENRAQGISQLTPDVLPQALNYPNLALYTSRKPELTILLFNLKNPEVPFLQELKIRKSILRSLNRQWMIDNLLQGQAIMADGVIFPGTWAYYENIKSIPYDPEIARRDLKEEGWVLAGETDTVRSKKEAFLKFRLTVPDTDRHKNLGGAIQRDLAAVGIQVELEVLPYETIINERLNPRTYQAALVDINFSKTPDPDPYPFWDQVQSTGGQNYAQWNNRVASEMLEQARITLDIDERTKLYRNFQLIFEDELPALPLFYPVYTWGADNTIRGIRMGPLFDTSDRFNTVADWYLAIKPVVQQTATPTKNQ
ncbi:MAG: peptide ABC transporter substrate-binding protein [Leptolinea sp.]|jgi:peptide/nickel transport system substrate-binding protein|nr:peptide ABC transporter substrate-binding protein [Leptolinea sp.]